MHNKVKGTVFYVDLYIVCVHPCLFYSQSSSKPNCQNCYDSDFVYGCIFGGNSAACLSALHVASSIPWFLGEVHVTTVTIIITEAIMELLT